MSILQDILHVGKHRRGANDLKSGYRCNLILWSSSLQREEREHACACHTPCPEWYCTALDRSCYCGSTLLVYMYLSLLQKWMIFIPAQ